MPHIIVKSITGKTEAQKKQLTEAITRDVMKAFNYGEDAVSVAFEDIPPERGKEDVYLSDINASSAQLYKEPGEPHRYGFSSLSAGLPLPVRLQSIEIKSIH